MRCAILADIHSNLAALKAVMSDIEKNREVDEIWCLGDIVGYGPDPHQCIEIIRQKSTVCIAGNHDLAAIGKTGTDYFNPEAAEAARWTGTQLTQEDVRFLGGLLLKIEKEDFTLVHGSPRDPVWEYIFSTNEAAEIIPYFKTRCCLIGHTHIPLIFECNDSSSCSMTLVANNTPIALAGQRLIINPGGVGQPRDRNPQASYAIFNSKTRTIIFYRVDYDIQATQKRMKEARLPPRLASRLAHGY